MNTNNTNKENKPHPHAELIKAWADGKTIQTWTGTEWRDCRADKMEWLDDEEYRIKPKEVKAWLKHGIQYFFVTSTCTISHVEYSGSNADISRLNRANCFRTRSEAEAAAERVKAALKGEVGDKVTSREEADSAIRCAMRCAIGTCAVVDKNTSLLRENNKLKEELESFVIRCECLQKAREELISQQAVIDNKPLSNGEIALIKALRKTWGFAEILKPGDAVVVTKEENGKYSSTTHNISFMLLEGDGSNTEVVNALELIDEEHKEENRQAIQRMNVIGLTAAKIYQKEAAK